MEGKIQRYVILGGGVDRIEETQMRSSIPIDKNPRMLIRGSIG